MLNRFKMNKLFQIEFLFVLNSFTFLSINYIASYYWPSLDNYSIRWCRISHSSDMINANFKLCDDPKWVKNGATIDALSGSMINIIYRSSYFDSNDLNNVLKHYNEDIITVPFIAGYFQTRYLSIIENRVYLKDSRSPFAEKNANKFYSINSDNKYEIIPAVDSDQGISLIIMMDSEINEYNIETWSYMEFSAIIGGATFFFYLLFSFVLQFYTEAVLFREIISKVKAQQNKNSDFVNDRFKQAISIMIKEFMNLILEKIFQKIDLRYI